jgi:tRNA G10  N-methylase Trm11
MSKLNMILKEVSKLGYKVSKEGKVLGVKGRNLSDKPITKAGYPYFSDRVNKIREIVLTHRLQAYQKFGESMFKKGTEVRHLNGDSLDNSWDNIEIGTHSQNMMDMSKENRSKKSSHPTYNHEEVLKDRKLGMTYKEIMKKHGIKSKSTVSHIINKSLIACEA